MTEVIYDSEKCVLWEKAKVLAKDRGLEMSESCPIDEFCTGTGCMMLTTAEKIDQARVRARLASLREEIKTYIKPVEPIIGC